MNRKGFTLIELLAVIILIALIAVLIVPNILDTMTKSKEASYQLLVKNIVTSSQMYYEECEYGDLSDRDKYESYACSMSGNIVNTTLGALANTGFLKVSDSKIENGTERKIVVNPKNNNDISDCQIKIAKVKKTNTDENGIENIKVTYEVTAKVTAESGSDCPTTEEYEGEVK